MAEAKTKPTQASVEAFVAQVEEPRRADCEAIIALLREASGAEPVMWGPGIIGFGKYHYRYATGHEGDAPLLAFSPRKANLTLYLTIAYERYPDLLAKLGKHKTGRACLYFKRLSDLDLAVLKELFAISIATSHELWGSDNITLEA